MFYHLLPAFLQSSDLSLSSFQMDQATPSSAIAKRKLVTRFLKSKQTKPTICNTNVHHQEPKHRENPDENKKEDEAIERNRATMAEAFITELFATVSALKAAYAEFQLAQFPYNQNSIQSADELVVQQFQTVSDMKQSFLTKQIEYTNPQFTLIKAEILEMQSLIKMYKITIKKLQLESENKDKESLNLRTELDQIISNNKLMEKKLSSIGQYSVMDTINSPNLNLNAFSISLQYTVRSIRNFVKQMVCEMESVKWDIEAAARSISSPQITFRNPNDICFSFESFVSGQMFERFNLPHFDLLKNETTVVGYNWRDQIMKLKSSNPIQFLKHNPKSLFGKFIRKKYLKVVHSKMEISFFGNPRQRRQISSGELPDNELFESFAEMARRVWLLHCLAFAFGSEVSVFQVERGCRFTEMYMESVTDDAFTADGCLTVGLTVEPGFRIGKNVIQSQVYVSL
ncbi:protein GRAVITROPIC IN THE LIGHT 1-like [Impatiens glandulifera]|uniref:protein GRAVITROPIC IN THE LIGHT 1-like n=1 Tax=Impatiens glandulifera TaxID=253017 RepID=UPI001FB0E1B1|nr:protein GRAVITROPIC IN THE LIGHT 1-like [Impatiens glandulifera]